MPWAGDTFTAEPVRALRELLRQPAGDALDLRHRRHRHRHTDRTDIGDAFQNLHRGLIVAFDPYVAGSPACPALCDLPGRQPSWRWCKTSSTGIRPTRSLAQCGRFRSTTTQRTVETERCRRAVADGSVQLHSGPTGGRYDTALSTINPELPCLYTNDGIVTDPNYLAFGDGTTTTFDPIVRRLQPQAGRTDLVTLLTNNERRTPRRWTDVNTVGDRLRPGPGRSGDVGGPAAGEPPPRRIGSSLDPSLSTDSATCWQASARQWARTPCR